MFWCNLTKEEAEHYFELLKIIKIWVAWANARPEERGPEPRRPIDQEFTDHELIAMKGWEVESDVRYWPKADMSHCTAHVRFRG